MVHRTGDAIHGGAAHEAGEAAHEPDPREADREARTAAREPKPYGTDRETGAAARRSRGIAHSKNQPFRARIGFAFAGLGFALRSEHSLKFQAGVFVAVVIALAFLRPEPLWWALALLAGCAVLAAELFNTALEHLADHLHPQVHPQIRIVKDCAAAGVLLAVLGAIAVAVALAVHLATRG